MILIACYPDWITEGCETELNNECDGVMKEGCIVTCKLTLQSLLPERNITITKLISDRYTKTTLVATYPTALSHSHFH